MSDAHASVVIADDEPLARRRLRSLLATHDDFEVVAECGDGSEVLAAVRRHRPDVLFLDVQMPALDGIAIARLVDADPPAIVVFVTAFEQYAVDAFDVRALDYILKPYDEERFRETLSRVRERLAMGRRRAEHAVLRLGDIEVDLLTRRVRRGGEVLVLRRREFDVLVKLLSRAGEVLTRRELLNDVWGYKEDVVSRTIDTHIFELRRKLGHPPNRPGHIETVARVGYRMVVEADIGVM